MLPPIAKIRALVAASGAIAEVPTDPAHCAAPVASSNARTVPPSSMTASEVFVTLIAGAIGRVTGAVHVGTHAPAHVTGNATTPLA